MSGTSDCVMADAAWQRNICVAKQGSASTVVWNPWAERRNLQRRVGSGERGTRRKAHPACVHVGAIGRWRPALRPPGSAYTHQPCCQPGQRTEGNDLYHAQLVAQQGHRCQRGNQQGCGVDS